MTLPESVDSIEARSSSLDLQPKQELAKVHRTLRACDRCRFKKSKCNGQHPCRNCTSSDRICVYSARRRRDARNWYCNMQETLDEAIQRLYRACKASNSFPGVLPDEQDDHVTTESILHGLGLRTAPPTHGATDPQNLSPHPRIDSSDETERTLDAMDTTSLVPLTSTSNRTTEPFSQVPSYQQPEGDSSRAQEKDQPPRLLTMCGQFNEIMNEHNGHPNLSNGFVSHTTAPTLPTNTTHIHPADVSTADGALYYYYPLQTDHPSGLDLTAYCQLYGSSDGQYMSTGPLEYRNNHELEHETQAPAWRVDTF